MQNENLSYSLFGQYAFDESDSVRSQENATCNIQDL